MRGERKPSEKLKRSDGVRTRRLSANRCLAVNDLLSGYAEGCEAGCRLPGDVLEDLYSGWAPRKLLNCRILTGWARLLCWGVDCEVGTGAFLPLHVNLILIPLVLARMCSVVDSQYVWMLRGVGEICRRTPLSLRGCGTPRSGAVVDNG